MEIIENSKEKIIERIKTVIINRHPIVEDRFDQIVNYPVPKIEVRLKPVSYDNGDVTVVHFCDGDETALIKIPESFVINGLIDSILINELIFEILLDHDYIHCATLTKDRLSLSFGVDLRENNMHGISCSQIEIIIDTSSFREGEELMTEFSNEIIKIYNSELNDALHRNAELTYKLMEQ